MNADVNVLMQLCLGRMRKTMDDLNIHTDGQPADITKDMMELEGSLTILSSETTDQDFDDGLASLIGDLASKIRTPKHPKDMWIRFPSVVPVGKKQFILADGNAAFLVDRDTSGGTVRVSIHYQVVDASVA